MNSFTRLCLAIIEIIVNLPHIDSINRYNIEEEGKRKTRGSQEEGKTKARGRQKAGKRKAGGSQKEGEKNDGANGNGT